MVSPDILLYGTGGLAWTRLTQTTNLLDSDGTFITTTPSWLVGWAAGAGAEMRLWSTNWLARVEYLHYDFGNTGSTISSFSAGGPPLLAETTTTRHLMTDIVRAGLDYQFH